MALRVWMPLTTSITNNGLTPLNNMTVGAGVTSSVAGGKIGQCYQFDGSTAGGFIEGFLPQPVTSSIGSLCCWVNVSQFPASGTWGYCVKLANTNSGYAGCLLSICFQYTNQIAIIHKGYVATAAADAYTHNLSTNTWYHLCETCDGTTATLYINGEAVFTTTKTSSLSRADRIQIGGQNNYSGAQLKGKLNDVRYYDHCLSPKEVKEISKGLVGHWLCNSPNTFTSTINTALPIDYQQVEYIENTNNAYIQLDWGSTEGMYVTVVGKWRTANCYLIGSHDPDNTNGWGRNGVYVYNNTTLEFGNGSLCPHYTISNPVGRKMTLSWSTVNHQSWASVDGYQFYSSTADNTQTSSTNLMIFRTQYSSGCAKAQFFSAIVKDKNQNLKMDLIPCYRKSDNKIGVYNLVNNTFYGCTGNGMICGPLVKLLPEGYDRLEYITNNIGAGINTGVIPTTTTRFHLDISWLPTSGKTNHGTAGSTWAVGGQFLMLHVQSNNTPQIRWHFGFTFDVPVAAILGQKYHLECLPSGINVDNTLYTTTQSNTPQSTTAWTIFKTTSGSYTNWTEEKLYSCQILTDGINVRDFVPSKRLSDSAVGLYDLVTDAFYPATTGTLSGTKSLLGNIEYDTSGYSHNMRIADRCTRNDLNEFFVSGNSPRYYGSYYFNYEDISELISDWSYVRSGTDELTVSAWIKRISGGGTYQNIIANRNGSGYNWMLFFYTNNGELCLHGSNQFKSGVYLTVDGLWHHICVTVKDNVSKTYIDGELVYTNNSYTYANVSTSSTLVHLGGWYSGREQLNGYMSDARVYATALSAADVKELYETSMIVDASGNILPRQLT